MIFKQLAKVVLSLLVACLVAIPSKAVGESAPYTFIQHFNKVCKANCIDANLLVFFTEAVAKDLGLDFKDLLAIMQVESGFIPKAYSRGNVGLMQVNLYYHRKKFKSSPYNVLDNIYVGATIYKTCLIKHKQSKPKALRCYNSEAVKDMIYPNKVLKALKELDSVSDL